MENPFTDLNQRVVYELFDNPLIKVPYPGRDTLECAYHRGAASVAEDVYGRLFIPFTGTTTEVAAYRAGRDRAINETYKSQPVADQDDIAVASAFLRRILPHGGSVSIGAEGTATVLRWDAPSGTHNDVFGGSRAPLLEALAQAAAFVQRDPVAEGWATLGLDPTGTRIMEG